MAIKLPGFDAELLYRVLSDFWKDYAQRDQLATCWGGLSQIMDNEYLQLYQSDFSKALKTVPVYWRYQWPNLEFDNWISNEVLHEHHWYEKTSTFILEQNSGELVEGAGFTTLVDPLVNFVTAAIGTGNVVVVGGESYRVTNVIAHELQINAVLPAATGVTYEVQELYFDLVGQTSQAIGACHAVHPTDDNVYEFTASSDIAEIEMPWRYTRGIGEITLTRNGTLLVVGDDYLESTDYTVTMIPAMVDGETLLVEKEIKVRVAEFVMNGVYMTEGVDFEMDPDGAFGIKLTEGLTARVHDGLGHNVMIKWHDITTPVGHSHRKFEEILDAPKNTWTNAAGDAFEPEPQGQGAYQFGDINAPIEIWVNGVKQTRDIHSEPDSVTFVIDASPEAGDRVVLRWIRNNLDPEQHKHLRYTNVLGSPTRSVTLPFSIDKDRRSLVVYVNGVIQTRDDDFEIVSDTQNVLSFDEDLVPSDIIEVEYYVPEFLYKHEIDSTIYAAPIIQDGIDFPTIISVEGEGHAIKDGWLFSNYDFDEAWVPNLFVNEPTTEKNFGDPVGFNKPNSIEYQNAVKALWYCYWNGPAFQRIEDGAKILLGVPFSPTDTKVTRRLEGSGLEDVVLEANNGSQYTVPEPLVPSVDAGEDVRAFQPLSTGVEVWDYVSNPEWYKLFPHLYQLWDQFSADGEPYFGFWDDRGELDDGGFFDDGGPGDPRELEAFNEKFFNLIKWFIFVVNVDASLLKDDDSLDDMFFYLDTIKPAYTKYLMIATLPGTDDVMKRRATDSVAMTVEMDIPDHYREVWDDEGNMDVTESGFHYAVGQPAQTDMDIPFPYRLGDDTLRIWVDGVLQVAGVDYQEVTLTTIEFNTPLAGGEDIYIYEDDSVYWRMDRGVAMDNVTFQLV